MPLFARWRAERDLHRKAQRFVLRLLEEPGDEDVRWLAQAATRGDTDHARWELRYARRALGLLAAERDALDDRTGAVVAHALAAAFEHDPEIAEGMRDVSERQFNARLSAYRDGLAARAGAGTAARLGQTLFAFAGGSFRQVDESILRSGELLMRYLGESNAALRELFGTAALPEHLPPSAVASKAER
ncbi:MAG TPA: hypothetical protein VJU87_07250 [Gemmatimonadaceae bacterium]|nr:hypothetical protein [Gemmatimonadaceae bacterium]